MMITTTRRAEGLTVIFVHETMEVGMETQLFECIALVVDELYICPVQQQTPYRYAVITQVSLSNIDLL